jgi:DNA ligase (NAD+)
VTGVVITIGHTGVIKPTASLEPVNIDNTSVKSAQLNNWDIIEAMDIAIGDTVRVVKAKDIIPYIEDVIERGENRVLIPRPVVCPVCSGEVKPRILIDGSLGSDLICQNNECDGRATRKVKNWIDKTRILYIGDMLLPILYERGITTPDKLYTLTVADLENIQTGAGILGNSNATKIIEQINKTRSLPLNVILGSMSIKHLGRRRAQQIMEKCPGQFDTIEDWLSDKLITLDVGMEGMAPEIAADIQNKRELIEAILTHVKVSSAVEVTSTPVVSNNINFIGKTFVFTGKIESVDEAGQRYTRERLQSIVLENGGKVDDKIKKSTPDNQYYLVQADPNSTSSKTEDAKKKGASIIGEQEFWQMVK